MSVTDWLWNQNMFRLVFTQSKNYIDVFNAETEYLEIVGEIDDFALIDSPRPEIQQLRNSYAKTNKFLLRIHRESSEVSGLTLRGDWSVEKVSKTSSMVLQGTCNRVFYARILDILKSNGTSVKCFHGRRIDFGQLKEIDQGRSVTSTVTLEVQGLTSNH